ncbi:nucleotidyltransferase family protein, partial [bacterium]|nr:nucleotidyltransferase family protein [bacterium]
MPSTSSPITQAIVLAAGFGTRLRPITDHVPKAMVTVAGKPLLDYALDHAQNAGVTRAVVNTHYLPHCISDHVPQRKSPEITLSHEPEILETGGGIKNVIDFFGSDPFFAINADSLWRDENPADGLLTQLKNRWNGQTMDALLAVIPREPANYVGAKNLHGDFAIEADGRLRRAGIPKPMPMVYIGVQILHPR